MKRFVLPSVVKRVKKGGGGGSTRVGGGGVDGDASYLTWQVNMNKWCWVLEV